MVLACRSVEKGEAARADIEASTGRQGVVEVMQVDLLSFESVKEFCARAARLDRVDVLLENASIAKGYFEENEGFESTITVNVLSTFLMAFLLLPTLRRTAAQHNVVTRLSIVSSDAHLFASLLPLCPSVEGESGALTLSRLGLRRNTTPTSSTPSRRVTT